ncbi:MAG: hypothetical protein IPN08_03035 [Bacteroidales bacterium]|nr:hypothetical protein [Bacteroidales bacterium]
MKNYYKTLILLVILTGYNFNSAFSQVEAVAPKTISYGTFIGESQPLRDLPVVSAQEMEFMKQKALLKAANKKIKPREYPFSETALPKGPDEAWQKSMGKSSEGKAPIVNFEGQSTSSYPPDCNGTIGPSHYMQTVNTTYAIYSRTGTLLAGPTNMNLLFGSVSGATCNDGDPLIQYDEMAGRWVAVEFSLCGSNDLMLMAVSSTNDPTGTWYQYSFDVTDTPDYEKLGIWQDGYYMGTNTNSGNDIYVFERSKMLLGQPAQMIAFDNPNRPGPSSGFLCVPPLDNDGVAAPAGTPGMFIAFNDDAVGGGSDQLWLYELAANWTTPSSSTFTRVQQIGVTAFDSQFTSSWDDITQPNSQKLDAVPQVIMNAPQYRNFGTYQTIVCCHSVDVDATNHAGIRWYELRKTSPATTWAIRQQGTFAPDGNSRWMGSVMLNGSGKIGMAYSISSSTVYPGIRYCGQSASAYASATGVMDIAETVIHTGTVAQTSYNRWGDYALLSVDPNDDQTFWFSSEYVKTGGSSKGTKIASFKFGNDPTVTTLAATAVAAPNATLNGTVNPNGLATTYYFQWGTSTSYTNTTTTTSAGSGTSAVAVSANITGLVAGTTYYFRLVATNSDGTAYGTDLSFTPGAAVLTTTAATSVTMNSAVSGGNISSDGGSAITARGVCWATTANPVATGLHTTDGSGTGSFTSTITGLLSNTVYHVRAYATNASGTYYGADLTFTTLCGTISSFPWNEGFENAGVIPNCWSQEQVASSGINWTFITGSGNSHPAAAHGGTYNACLKDLSSGDNKTRLITPTINLSTISSPVLTFWHTQAVWSGDQDQLVVYYKNSAGGTWTAIGTYTASITAWTMETINLPASSSDYYIAFEGNAKYGYGVCVDDVSITGTTTSPTLAVAPASQNVTPTAGSTAFTVTSNSAWTAVSNQTWCTVTPSGTGNGTITATYTQNNTAASRTANVTVTVTGLSPVVVTVVQAAPTLAVTPSNQAVSPASGSTTFAVTTNSTWTAASNQTWCTVTASGTGNGTITATFAENNTASQRIADVTVTTPGLTPIVVTVTQAAPTLAVAPANQNVAAAAGSTQFSLTSNTSWAATSDQGWCAVTPSGTGNGTISATYTENTSVNARVASVTVTVNGLTSIVVTVTQAGATPALAVTPSTQSVTTAAGNTSFNVTSNTAWTVVSDQSWCTVTPSGSGNGTITATYTQNTSSSARTASITVSASGVSPVTVTVVQAGLPASEFLLTIQNMWQTAPNVYEFDIYLQDVDASVPFQLATIQAGINFNTAILNGAAITTGMTTIVPGSSDLPSNMAPISVSTTSAGLIRMAGRAAPGAGNGYIVSTSEPGTRIARLRVTNSIAFAYNSAPDMSFTSSAAITPSYATRVAKYEGTVNTQLTVTPGVNAIVYFCPLLNGPPALSVSPMSQSVAADAGSFGYTVTSNASWTAVSDQTWCTLAPASGFGNGTITANFTQNTGAPRSANITVSVSGLSDVIVVLNQDGTTTKTLNLFALLEGLYDGNGTMRQASDENGAHFGAGVADVIDIELHNTADYSLIEHNAANTELSTSGNATISIPPSFGSNYYITVKHRNSIETTSANPVSFAGPVISYAFDLPAKAFGGNLLQMIDGYYTIYGGDVNQDGTIDTGDGTPIDNDQFYFVSGYVVTDINGDGTVDTGDGTIVDNNQFFFVGTVLP